ncbi:MAG TPA: hypothetical protein CFH84_10915 [Sulfurimonas sp. UBA12504]|nr:MAG: hypothetical protein A2019_06255 [Sulfurimonas sp. GWF2_37_8]DAB29155.1 MAG TPA: hypothetical protein CFH84_10915 [Sulfurimonas sp. UBA12504]
MKYLLLTFILVFSGCSTKNYEHTQTKIIIIKSPKLKFADVAYLRHNEEKIELEIFVAGTAVEKIAINHLICVSEGCMSKSNFNQDYLHASYPEDMLQNVLLGKSIYDGQNRVKSAEGFEQKIQNATVDIEYKVAAHLISFKDKKNGILLKLKDTNE